MQRARVVLLCLLAICAVASTGLCDLSSITFTVAGGYGVTVYGSYDYGTLHPYVAAPSVARTVRLNVWSNVPYLIGINANDHVKLNAVDAADITLNNLHFTRIEPSADVALSATYSAGPPPSITSMPIIRGTIPTNSTDYYPELRLVNRAGGELPGDYAATVTFTIVQSP